MSADRKTARNSELPLESVPLFLPCCPRQEPRAMRKKLCRVCVCCWPLQSITRHSPSSLYARALSELPKVGYTASAWPPPSKWPCKLAIVSSSAAASVPALGSVPCRPTPSCAQPHPNQPDCCAQLSSTRRQQRSCTSTSGAPTTMHSAWVGVVWMFIVFGKHAHGGRRKQ